MLDVLNKLNSLKGLYDQLIVDKEVHTENLKHIVDKLYNKFNSSQIVLNWFNNLIKDYNEQFSEYEPDSCDFTQNQNYSLYCECLYSTFDYFMPFLSTYEKLTCLIDMCVLCDDENEQHINLHNKFFEQTVNRTTEYAESVKFRNIASDNEIDNYLIFLIGYFNFRIQRYDIAIDYLKICESRQSRKLNNYDSIKKYLNSVTFLSESYEYINGDNSGLNDALKLLIGKSGDEILERVKQRKDEILKYLFDSYSNIFIKDNQIKSINGFFNFFYNDSEIIPNTYKVFSFNNVNKSIKDFVHVTAHCLSEYAAKSMKIISQQNSHKKIKKDIQAYSILQLASRFLMDWLVVQDSAYITCQATIRAENDACPEAIDILLKRLKEFDNKQEEKLTKAEKKERAELQFYIFYFAEQELEINNNNDKLINIFEENGQSFYNYAKEANDDDALFHYLVIQFKHLLKKGVRDLLRRTPNSSYYKLDEIYYEITSCKKKPLPHVFRELIEESNRLIDVYLLFREYRYLYTKDADKTKIQEFNNRLYLKDTISIQELGINNSEEKELDIDNDEDDGEQDPNFLAINSLIQEIEERKNILILAPVKQAPSCYSDYSPINPLCLIGERENIKTPIFSGDTIYTTINEISDLYSQVKIHHTYISCEDKNLIKWVIYHHSGTNSLWIFYNEQEDSTNGEMFQAKLNNNEKKQLETLLNSLKNNMFYGNERKKSPILDCSQKIHTELHGGGGACSTRMIRGYDIAYNPMLAELLSFAEFDLFSQQKTKKIAENDYIIYTTKNESYGKSFKIVCFKDLPNSSIEGICCYCTCTTNAAELTSLQQLKEEQICEQADGVKLKSCEYNERHVDLYKIKALIVDAKESMQSQFPCGEAWKDYEIVEKYINENCLSGYCSYDYVGSKCKSVLDAARSFGIVVPFLED